MNLAAPMASGLRSTFLASLFTRLPIGAIGLAILLRVEELTGSYALGGLVTGVNTMAFAVASPVLGRLVDRRGHTPVLLASAVVHSTAMITLAMVPAGFEPALVIALVTGASFPPISACMRTLWMERLSADRRHAALATDSVLMELCFIAGPAIFIAGIGSWSRAAAVAACGLVAASGAAWFALTAPARAWRAQPRADGRVGAMRGAAVRRLVFMCALFGASIGAIEVATAGFADDEGRTGMLAVLLGLWGLGSIMGGVIAARRPAPEDPARTLAFYMAWLGAATLPLALAQDMVSLGALIFVAGVFIAPAMAVANGLLGEVAPAGTMTEAFTWSTTGTGGGIALGAAVGGWMVESAGAAGAYAFAGAAAVAGAAVTAAGITRLRSARAPAPA